MEELSLDILIATDIKYCANFVAAQPKTSPQYDDNQAESKGNGQKSFK